MPGMPACASGAPDAAGASSAIFSHCLRFENLARAHGEVAIADARIGRIAIGGLFRGFHVLLRLVDIAEHQVRVLQPAERVEILATFSQLHARVELDRRLVGGDVRCARVGPHAKLYEDVRGHMQRVRGRWRNAGVRARRGKRQRRVIRIVERVNDEVRRARMFRIFREHLLRNRRRERLTAEAAIGRSHGTQQRQRVPRRHFVIVGPLGIHGRQRLGVCGVARELLAGRVIEHVNGADEGLFLGQLHLGQPLLQRGRNFLEDRLGRFRVLLGPQRMVVAHRFAPVRHHERGIDFLRALERHRGFIKLKAVKALDAFQEGRLRGGRAGSRERDGAELLRPERCQRDEHRHCNGRTNHALHHLFSTGIQGCGYAGPVYSARGRIKRLFAYCSSTCAVQPLMRLTAKIGV